MSPAQIPDFSGVFLRVLGSGFKGLREAAGLRLEATHCSICTYVHMYLNITYQERLSDYSHNP